MSDKTVINYKIYQQGVLFDSEFLIINISNDEKTLCYKTRIVNNNENVNYSNLKEAKNNNGEFYLVHDEVNFENERKITIHDIYQLLKYSKQLEELKDDE